MSDRLVQARQQHRQKKGKEKRGQLNCSGLEEAAHGHEEAKEADAGSQADHELGEDSCGGEERESERKRERERERESVCACVS